MNLTLIKKWAALCCLVVTSSFLALPTQAQPTAPQEQNRGAFRLQLGYYSQYNRIEIAYQSPTIWQSTLFNHPIDLQLEASGAYWHTDNNVGSNSRTSIWQIGLTPMFRWWANHQWYIEAGIGATMISHTRFADKEFSTMFQFGDHIGVARTFGNDWRVGLRLSHFSNASIKRPNSGLNILQLTFSRLF